MAMVFQSVGSQTLGDASSKLLHIGSGGSLVASVNRRESQCGSICRQILSGNIAAAGGRFHLLSEREQFSAPLAVAAERLSGVKFLL
jgi:hypothetical protein